MEEPHRPEVHPNVFASAALDMRHPQPRELTSMGVSICSSAMARVRSVYASLLRVGLRVRDKVRYRALVSGE